MLDVTTHALEGFQSTKATLLIGLQKVVVLLFGPGRWFFVATALPFLLHTTNSNKVMQRIK